ncbi:profilin, putative [Entamoeba histolytica HM-1:IMSS-B]|uniref:Profilin n=8 Tax=Entamoeba TaxID=5758 RepID=C4M3K9_ENTH1|nr:profilin, putative [Entamoeba nuttalli P19]XP_652204.1 profilin, putative [Entamoeba histolytica HM-1:IMSS]EMD42526.1 profilin, putative [Entamoeba histolytica KU27]EMH73823.1 profilin, putative [Entamoeba histolytica HM-1:IMSS-B]EMS17133.1 profilin, putative [Entamoeba histolytica HM-3:IMSS]ENY60325.1 profilin, putative [Entamoeba histolytica HM-1:IMSS-A]GAT95909.1 profilin putative [Entamoeba histolytica]|eukprot:XP_008859914.1 profilin, putative [Entamoeba nuttalli P19]
MTWQEYVDVELIGSGYCKSAVIIGMDGTENAVSLHCHLEKNEIANLISLFGDSKKRQTGMKIKLKGTGCIIQYGGDRTITAMSEKEDEGFVIVKTKQVIIVATYGDYMKEEQCLLVVEKLADYLIQKGF